MKKVLLATLPFLLATNLHAADLTINISNIKSKDGTLDVAIYNDAKAFNSMSNDLYASLSLPPYSETVSLSLHDFPKGTYAICVQQDLNRNGLLDTGKSGYPTEPYACSNGAGKTKAATFKEAKMTSSDSDTTVELKLIQLQ